MGGAWQVLVIVCRYLVYKEVATHHPARAVPARAREQHRPQGSQINHGFDGQASGRVGTPLSGARLPQARMAGAATGSSLSWIATTRGREVVIHDRAEPGSALLSRAAVRRADVSSNASHGSYTSSTTSMLRRRAELA